MQAREPKIVIDDVCFRYGAEVDSTWIIDHFSLDVFDNEFVSIVGPSGCGKSTLLNIVAGLLNASSGRILMNGEEIGPPAATRTMVFQDDAVFPWYTVEQNVEYGLKAIHLPPTECKERVDRYLEMVGLADDRDKYPRQLSGGMRKRVDIARAMVMSPEVLLMDEPFAALDVMTKERLQEEFMALWNTTKTTVLFVTHDLEEALYLSERVVVMSRNPGRLERVVQVDLPQPRELAVKTTNTFQGMRRDLTNVLHTMHGGLEKK